MSKIAQIAESMKHDLNLLNASRKVIEQKLNINISDSNCSKAKIRVLKDLTPQEAKTVRDKILINNERLINVANSVIEGQPIKQDDGRMNPLPKHSIAGAKYAASPNINSKLESLASLSLSPDGKFSRSGGNSPAIPISSSNKNFGAYEVIFIATDYTDDAANLFRQFVGSLNDSLGQEELSIIETLNPRGLEVRKEISERV